MDDAVMAWCRWLEETPWGATIRASSWMYPIVLWIHFTGLSIWLGAVLSVDLRVMGLGARRQSVLELTRGLYYWKWIGGAIAFVSGFLLLSAQATTYLANTGIRLKIAVLIPLAMLSDVAVQKNASARNQSAPTSASGTWAASIEFLLWISVVAASVGFLLTNADTHP